MSGGIVRLVDLDSGVVMLDCDADLDRVRIAHPEGEIVVHSSDLGILAYQMLALSAKIRTTKEEQRASHD